MFSKGFSNTMGEAENQLADELPFPVAVMWIRLEFQPPICQELQDTCEDTCLYRLLMDSLFPPLLLICLFGNTFNIAVYTMEYFQKFV